METKGLYYFAHPYTAKKKDGSYSLAAEDANFKICNYRAGELIRRGYNVYSPISHTHPIHMATPSFVANEVHEPWYQLDDDVIYRCKFDGIILAPGWENSKGCVHERELFEELHRDILLYEKIILHPILT